MEVMRCRREKEMKVSQDRFGHKNSAKPRYTTLFELGSKNRTHMLSKNEKLQRKFRTDISHERRWQPTTAQSVEKNRT